jgi:hypothetical protein
LVITELPRSALDLRGVVAAAAVSSATAAAASSPPPAAPGSGASAASASANRRTRRAFRAPGGGGRETRRRRYRAIRDDDVSVLTHPAPSDLSSKRNHPRPDHGRETRRERRHGGARINVRAVLVTDTVKSPGSPEVLLTLSSAVQLEPHFFRGRVFVFEKKPRNRRRHATLFQRASPRAHARSVIVDIDRRS